MVDQAVVSLPAVLTMEEFRANWEPGGWQLLIIGPTATWRTEWGEWEAIREIVQNALDESEYYTWGYDDQGLFIRDVGKGIAVADFLLGPARVKPAHARGKFGEGMKIAALALLRKGYSVKVDTAGRELWLTFLRVKTNGHAEQLAALWRSGGRRQGTVVHVAGYTGSAFEDRFAVNIPRRHILHQGPSQLREPVHRYNQLIAEPPGRIYARDIYMRDVSSPFSYNLWSFDLAPDRHAPKSEGDMWLDVGRLWATVTDVGLLERFLGMVKDPPLEETDEAHNVSMDAWNMGHEPATDRRYADFVAQQGYAWREAWRRRMGDDAVIRTSERWDGTVRHLGYRPVSLSWLVRDTLALAIKTDAALVKESQERLREAQVVPDSGLSPKQLAHIRLARKIADRFRHPPLAAVHAAIIPPASDRMRTAGLYSTTLREVYIATDQLERASWTVDTVIHEIAHHTSGAEDGAEAHSLEMTRVAARVVQDTAAGAFDQELKEATW